MALDNVLAPPAVISDVSNWPPHYPSIYAWRVQQLQNMRENPDMLLGALEYYRTRPIEFICHWVDTYDPRKAGTSGAYMPFVMFQRQAEYIEFLQSLEEAQANGLAEKCRDAGMTWASIAYSWHRWRFSNGVSVGWGSRKEQLVDRIGDADSILEKFRIISKRMPVEFLPRGFQTKQSQGYMKMINPENGSTVTGEAGDNIGRGGRKSIYFKDESAHYERPELIEAALGDNTNVQIDISSVNGLGNVFNRRRLSAITWEPGMVLEKAQTYVFVFDWRDHPEKDQAWYDARKAKAAKEGMLHLFYQEVDRKYDASVLGTIIPSRWVEAAIDAHKKLGWEPVGEHRAGFDVADNLEEGDANALVGGRGNLVSFCETWGSDEASDVGSSTVRVIEGLSGFMGNWEIEYDCIGMGAAVKSTVNDRIERGEMPDNLEFKPWMASAAVLFKDKHILTLPDGTPDTKSPTHGELFQNMKAQAWYFVARRFEKTFKAVTEGAKYDPEELISLDGSLEELEDLKRELSQPTMTKMAGSQRMVVNKKPKGTKSPNRADALVMKIWESAPEEATFQMVLSSKTRSRVRAH